MGHDIARFASLAAALSLTGCVLGDAGPLPRDDVGEPTGEPETVDLSGQVIDYFGGQPLGGVAIETLGLGVERSVESADDGSYVLAEVPQAGLFFLVASAEATHRPTIDDEVWIDSESIEYQVRVVSRGDAERQHATAGLAVDPEAGMVIVELVDGDGAALTGLSRDEVSLINPATGEVAAQPLFIGALGDVDPALDTSAAFAGRSRAVFLNVGEGVWDLMVSCGQCDPISEAIKPVPVTPGGASLTTAALPASAPGQGPATGFARVHRILQRGAEGGAGCANCHTAGGSAGLLPFDLEPADLYSALTARPDVVDTGSPADSLLLSKPLYEVPANHPNATWVSTDHPDYQAILEWIEGGAAP